MQGNTNLHFCVDQPRADFFTTDHREHIDQANAYWDRRYGELAQSGTATNADFTQLAADRAENLTDIDVWFLDRAPPPIRHGGLGDPTDDPDLDFTEDPDDPVE